MAWEDVSTTFLLASPVAIRYNQQQMSMNCNVCMLSDAQLLTFGVGYVAQSRCSEADARITEDVRLWTICVFSKMKSLSTACTDE